MKQALVAGTLFISMLSCTYNDIRPPVSTAVPAREVWYDWDGTELGVNTLTYDANKNLIREYFKSEVETRHDLEKTYQYDADDRLVKKTEGNPGNEYYITEISYSNDLKVSQTEYNEGQGGLRTVYYYTGTRIDSAVRLTYPGGEPYGMFGTDIFVYDDQQHLVQEGPFTFYQYDDKDRIISTCRGDINAGLATDCYLNEYNVTGQLEKTYLSYPLDNIKYIMEQYFFENGRRTEKWSYNWFYLMGPSAPDIFKIKYEYDN